MTTFNDTNVFYVKMSTGVFKDALKMIEPYCDENKCSLKFIQPTDYNSAKINDDKCKITFSHFSKSKNIIFKMDMEAQYLELFGCNESEVTVTFNIKNLRELMRKINSDISIHIWMRNDDRRCIYISPIIDTPFIKYDIINMGTDRLQSVPPINTPNIVARISIDANQCLKILKFISEVTKTSCVKISTIANDITFNNPNDNDPKINITLTDDENFPSPFSSDGGIYNVKPVIELLKMTKTPSNNIIFSLNYDCTLNLTINIDHFGKVFMMMVPIETEKNN